MQCFANNKDAYKQLVAIFPMIVPCNILPLHKVFNPLHVPLAWQVRLDDPLRINPGSHLNCTLLGKTVKLPDKDPFLGIANGPQLTAAKAKVKYYYVQIKDTFEYCFFVVISYGI